MKTYALITGASKGIGKALAEQLAARKKNVILVARSEQELAQVAADIEKKFGVAATFFPTDLSAEGAAQQVYDWCVRQQLNVDTLVNNAGYGLSGLFDQQPLSDHLNMMQLNMNTVVELTYLFLPQLKTQPKSYVLNVASSAAYQAVPYLSVYAASKAFVLQFSRGLHHELKGTSVSVTCVSPGSTDTAFVDRAQIGEKGRQMAKKVNMTPEVVAQMAVDALYKGKPEIITGLLNQLGAAMAWLLPKSFIEKTTAKIYR